MSLSAASGSAAHTTNWVFRVIRVPRVFRIIGILELLGLLGLLGLKSYLCCLHDVAGVMPLVESAHLCVYVGTRLQSSVILVVLVLAVVTLGSAVLLGFVRLDSC